MKEADHDELLDNIRDAIKDAQVVICLPGSRPSFVENEVSMAFALNKPLLFVVSGDEYSRLPNTAKRGYPIFNLVALREEKWTTLARFAAYLAADPRSTIRVYAAIFQRLKACMAFVLLAYGLSIALATGILGIEDTRRDLYSVGIIFLCVGVGIFLIPYLIYFLNRYLIRSELRAVISGKRFDVRLLPDVLEFSLTRVDLVKVQWAGGVIPEHKITQHERRNVGVVVK
jgi:hypothetical protein